MHFNSVLDKERLSILPKLKKIPSSFYLSGGTALALQLNHRISIDFDFFSPDAFDTQELIEKLSFDVFEGDSFKIVQEAENSLDIVTEKAVKISFFRYRYLPLFPLIQTPYFKVADKLDIGASKLIAIAQRSSQKDFFDLYYLLQHFSLEKIFDVAALKYPSFNPVLYLKALTYFDDCDSTPPVLISDCISFSEVKTILTEKSLFLFENLNKLKPI